MSLKEIVEKHAPELTPQLRHSRLYCCNPIEVSFLFDALYSQQGSGPDISRLMEQ